MKGLSCPLCGREMDLTTDEAGNPVGACPAKRCDQGPVLLEGVPACEWEDEGDGRCRGWAEFAVAGGKWVCAGHAAIVTMNHGQDAASDLDARDFLS